MAISAAGGNAAAAAGIVTVEGTAASSVAAGAKSQQWLHVILPAVGDNRNFFDQFDLWVREV